MFNKRFSRVRWSIERAFGKLKSQWLILKSGRYYFQNTVHLIAAACVLHNVTLLDPDRDYSWDGIEPRHDVENVFEDVQNDYYCELSTNESRKAGETTRNYLLQCLHRNFRTERQDY